VQWSPLLIEPFRDAKAGPQTPGPSSEIESVVEIGVVRPRFSSGGAQTVPVRRIHGLRPSEMNG